MLTAIIFILILSLGGIAFTYLFEKAESLLWRLAAGIIIGHCLFGTLLFLTSFIFGFGTASILVSAAITLAPIGFVLKGERRHTLNHDWAKARGKLEGANLQKFASFFYYAAFLTLFVAFFDRAMLVNDLGIFTGGSQNLGDLPFHLGIIFGLVDGANFPPQNPSFAGAKFSYPFVADMTTAAFVKLGVGVRESMFVQNVAWAFALLVILIQFVYKLVNDQIAAKLAPPILFFSGGLGFLWFFSDLSSQTKGLFDLLANLPKDYTIGSEFRWGNSLVTLFLTQRSLLLGMPLTLLVLGELWQVFTSKEDPEQSPTRAFPLTFFLIGVMAGMLPLIHLHSLVVLFLVTLFLLVFRLDKWREWLTFGAGVCAVAIPELIWSVTGSASNATEFFEFHFGWDSGNTNLAWFWIKNTGLFFALLIFGIYVTLTSEPKVDEPKAHKGKKRSKIEDKAFHAPVHSKALLLFYLPFGFVFVLSNLVKLAPWEWDNIKVLIYWFVGSIPFVVLALVWLWRRSGVTKVLATLCFLGLIFAGALDVFRTVSRTMNYKVFDKDAVAIADRIKATTDPNAVFLNAPTYNSAVVLSGRRSLMRYPGHLDSHGIDYKERENDVKQMYRGGPAARRLFEKYGIDYVLISPEERTSVAPNEAFFSSLPLVAESGQYKVYKVNNE